MSLTVASLFAGIGGLDLGFEWAGADVIWASDISPIATKSYAINFGRPAIEADIMKLDISSIPDADLIIGGPPCQSFSLVGLRRDDDPRGQLVFRFVEIVRVKKPVGFVMENVPGLAAARINGRRLSEVLVDQFKDLGYQVSLVKLDASNFMVPQMRKRVFILGSKVSSICAPDPREFAAMAYGISANSYDNSSSAALLDLGPPTVKGRRAAYTGGRPSIFAAIMRKGMSDFSLHEHPRMSDTDKKLVRVIPPGGNYKDVPDELATSRIMKFKRTGGRTTTYGRLHPDRPSYTLNTYFRRPNVGSNFHPLEDRLITVREAMRLQSIPDRFEIALGGAQDARNALVGNAVPPLLGQAVARELLRAICGELPQVQPDIPYKPCA